MNNFLIIGNNSIITIGGALICQKILKNQITKIITNQITIKQDIQIEKLTTENAAKLNDMSAEQIEELISAIALRVMSLYGENISSLSSGFNISQSSTGRTNNAFNTAAGSTDQANVATNSTVNE